LTRSEALAAAEGLEPTAKNILRLAQTFGQETASWAFNQWSLRARARKKFSNADSMLFTPAGLEQSSHESVAAYHASLFPADVLVADLTCGIGGDLIALSKRGRTVGYEKDPLTAEYARHNAPDADIKSTDCMDAEWQFEHAFADPSRRHGKARTLKPDEFEPDPSTLAERMRQLRTGCIKLSPMLSDDYLTSISSSIEFISFGWECREALALFGAAFAPGKFAIKIETRERLPSGGFAMGTDDPKDFIYEADPAAIRAHCLPAICNFLDAETLGDSNGYLTSPDLQRSDWTRAYRVLDFGAFDIKRLRGQLQQLGGGAPEVKSRVKVDVREIRKRLSSDGDATHVVLLYPVGKSIRYAIAEAITNSD
jgi:hypothetical protein